MTRIMRSATVRRTAVLYLTGTLSIMPVLQPSAVWAQTAEPAAVPLVPMVPMEALAEEVPQDDPPVDRQLLAVGAGAIIGIVAFNILAAPLGAVPLAGAALAEVPYNIALGSRLIATATAGAGALTSIYAYDQWTGHESDYPYLMTLATGALGGVALGNILTGTIGTLPYFAGAGEAVGVGPLASSAAQAASRVYVIASGVFGAWTADWLYPKE
jgi:hypothetical protein